MVPFPFMFFYFGGVAGQIPIIFPFIPWAVKYLEGHRDFMNKGLWHCRYSGIVIEIKYGNSPQAIVKGP